MPPSDRIPFEGVLNCWNDDHDLPDLLLSISRSGKTGRLQFSNPEGDKTLYMKEGKIVFAESSSQDDGLGQFLLRTGQISLMDYTRVSKMEQPGKRLGALLIEQKVLEQTELRPAVIGQVHAIILGLFRRTETWYSFKEMEPPPAESITLDIAVADMILKGVRYVESWRRVSKGVGNLDSVYHRATEDTWSELNLDGSVEELLDMLLEPVSLEEICTRAILPDFEACRYLWAFRSLGWIELVDAAELSARDAITSPAVAAPPPQPTLESLAQTQMAVEPPAKPVTPIPEHLIETRVAMDRPSMSPPPPSEAPSPTPAANPEQTQLALEPPTAVPEHLVNTQETVPPPPEPPAAPSPAIPEELLHTQMFVEPPSTTEPPATEPPPETVSTGEFMESILEDDTGEPPEARTTPAPPAPADQGATQFFEGPSALPSEATPPEAPPPPPPSAAPSGFEALMDDGPGTSPPGPPTPADTPTLPSVHPSVDSGEGAMASFGDVSMPDVPAEPAAVPMVEAEVITTDATEEPLPSADELLPPPTSTAPRKGGLDLEKEFRHVLEDKPLSKT